MENTFRPSTLNELYGSANAGAPPVPGNTNWTPILITTGIVVVGVLVIAIAMHKIQVASTIQIIKNINYNHEEKLDEVNGQFYSVNSTLSEMREEFEKMNIAKDKPATGEAQS